MTKSQTTRGSAGWRGRVLLPAGLAAAVVMGGVAVPTAAFAAVIPPAAPATVTLTAPAQVANNGTPPVGTTTNRGTLDINTGADGTTETGSALASGMTGGNSINAHFVMTVPTGLLASQVTVTLTHSDYVTPYGPVTLTASGSTLVGDVSIDPTDNVQKIDKNYFTYVVDSPSITGTLTSVVTLQQYNEAGAFDGNIVSSNTATTKLVGPSAPVFSGAPPAATIYQAYSKSFTATGFPAVPAKGQTGHGTVGWAVYQHHVLDATTPSISDYAPLTAVSCSTPAVITDVWCFNLAEKNTAAGFPAQPKLVFNAKTGVISGTAADLNKSIANPESYVVLANNGVAGATAADVTAAATAKVPLYLNDVSKTINIPVLFSDVAFSDTFGPAIYSLAGQTPYSVIQGYGDGTFRPNITVTRQAFVHFAAQVINNKTAHSVGTGPCNASTNPSGFSDVPNSSAFCQEIQDLSTLGVVNGYTDGTFGPTNIVSRQAIAAFLYRVDLVVRGLNANTQGDAQCTGSAPFNDVAVTDQFCGDISWMADNGIAAGYSDGGFHPLASSSRQATAYFLYKLEIFEGTVTP